MRNDLHGGRSGADDADPLVGQAVESAVRVASGIGVVPPTGVEGMAFELPDSGDPRELRPVQGSVAHHEEPGRHAITAVRRDGPAQAGVVPFDGGDLGGQARALVQVEVPGDAMAVLQNLGGADVLLTGDVGGLLQEREVDVRLDVALCSWVPVPVPGAAEVAALLNDAKVVDARLGEPGAGDQAGETAADDGNGDVVAQWGTIDRLRVGINEVRREWPRHLDVLGVRILPDPLVALEPVLLAQRVGVEGRRRRRSCRRCSPFGVPCGLGASASVSSSASARQRSPAGRGEASERRDAAAQCAQAGLPLAACAPGRGRGRDPRRSASGRAAMAR